MVSLLYRYDVGVVMKIEGYVGICGACFEPIKEGTEIQFSEKGKYFHKSCFEENPDSYYLAIERIRAEFEKETNPTELMNEMENIFKIPVMNDLEFNEENPMVIKLYREIANSREL